MKSLGSCFNIFIALTIISISANCQFRTEREDYFPDSEWRTSTPEAQGLDEQMLKELITGLRNDKLLEPVSSLTIVKNGFMVINETFGGYDDSEPHTLQSVTKSITSTLVGVAIQNGFIDNLDQRILDFFPEYDEIDHMTSGKKVMNLRHALTMRTGQAWTGERHLGPLNRFSGDKIKYVLDYKMETEPGRKWYYNSGIAILLGGLLQNATEMDTRVFAQKYLFEPLGIRSARWGWAHRGIPHTGGGLYLKPTDMARIGYLYLRNGRWENQQILPDGWVKEATRVHVPETESISGLSNIGYGYMWWLLPLDKASKVSKSEIYMAYGHWGQFIFVIPRYDMVVVWTNDSTASYAEEIRPISLFHQFILSAINL